MRAHGVPVNILFVGRGPADACEGLEDRRKLAGKPVALLQLLLEKTNTLLVSADEDGELTQVELATLRDVDRVPVAILTAESLGRTCQRVLRR